MTTSAAKYSGTAGIAAGAPGAASAAPPMWYLETFGSPGKELADITWALLIVSIAVVVVIAALVAIGLAKLRGGVDLARDRDAVKRPGDRAAMRWIYGGLALTTLILVGFVFWTVETLAAIEAPESEPRVTVRVTAHQWWWELEYTAGDRTLSFETANEIHVPVGEPVRFELASADVIHSFWVPALGGKTDLIPGQTNVAWLEADAPGVYHGQCAEYCGLQHAHMSLRVFAEPREEFAAWWDAQLEDAPAPDTAIEEAGRRVFVENCAVCHTVRGLLTGGETGPDLTHLMSRSTLAAGMLPNTVGHLSGWISNPEALKPGTLMPKPDLSGPELDALRAYLVTLE